MAIKSILIPAVCIILAGCSSLRPGSQLAKQGRLITSITEPFNTDFNSTPVGSKQCIIKNFKIQEPITGYNMYAEWSRNELRNAAMQAGITNICHIDIHTFSLLSGVYRKRNLIIYGD